MPETAANVQEILGGVGSSEAGENGIEEWVLSSFELEEAACCDARVWIGVLRCFLELNRNQYLEGQGGRGDFTYDGEDVKVDSGCRDIAVLLEELAGERYVSRDGEALLGHG